MALFSLVYVVGVQLALYNFLTTIGIPFFHLQLRFGLGFVYDLVSFPHKKRKKKMEGNV